MSLSKFAGWIVLWLFRILKAIDNFMKRFWFIPIVIITIMYLFFAYTGVYGHLFHPDSPIVFDGAYRILQGQVPYSDFTTPTGPIVFYLQAFFMLVFGSTLFASVMHIAMLSMILGWLLYSVTVKKLGPIISILISAFFFISYYGVVSFPWYNQTAFFFLILNILLIAKFINKDSDWLLPVSALLATLALFSKQDIGALHFIFILAYFTYDYLFNREFKWSSLLKIFLRYILPFAIFTGIIFVLLSQIPSFLTYFNYGQDPHSSRLGMLFSLRLFQSFLHNSVLWLLLPILVVLLLKEKDKLNRKLLFLSIVNSLLVVLISISSGQSMGTFLQFSPITAYLLFAYYTNKSVTHHRKNIIFKATAKHVAVFVLLLVLWVYMQPMENLARPAFFTFNDYPNYAKMDSGCYKDALFIEEDLEGFNKLKGILHGKDFIDFDSRFAFLYCDYNVKPITGIPLWYSPGITLYELDNSRIIQAIGQNSPDAILLRHSNNAFLDYFTANGYDVVYGVEMHDMIFQKTMVLVKNEN
ncbi:ArnT family glycosyltransferase [Nanoarchaeota archaeon]